MSVSLLTGIFEIKHQKKAMLSLFDGNLFYLCTLENWLFAFYWIPVI